MKRKSPPFMNRRKSSQDSSEENLREGLILEAEEQMWESVRESILGREGVEVGGAEIEIVHLWSW